LPKDKLLLPRLMLFASLLITLPSATVASLPKDQLLLPQLMLFASFLITFPFATLASLSKSLAPASTIDAVCLFLNYLTICHCCQLLLPQLMIFDSFLVTLPSDTVASMPKD
jgi:hypothetical protein